MARGTLVSPKKVRAFHVNDAYDSRMLLDNTNSEAKNVQINYGVLKKGCHLLPPSKHGDDTQGFDETYIIHKGACKLWLDGELLYVKEGDVIFIPGGVSHGLDNTEGECDLEIFALSSHTPIIGSGHSEVYDQRVAAWGKSFMLEEEE